MSSTQLYRKILLKQVSCLVMDLILSALTDACRTDCVRYTEQVPFFDMELFDHYSNPHKMAIKVKTEK